MLRRVKPLPLVLALVLAPVWSACLPPEPGSEFESLGSVLDALMAEHRVPGVGFAVFDDSGLLFEHVAGVKRRATTDAIDVNTVFEAASISKPVFAYVVFSLARDGLLNLDAPLTTLVPQLPELGHDPRAGRLTPRILLTHRGGLPNWRSRLQFGARSYGELFAPDDTLEFVVDPDTEYRYSGEGYVLLQRIVEEVTGMGLNELARARVFDPLGMARTSYLFDEETRRNYALGHDAAGAPDKWELHVPLASSTLHTTAADLAKFGAHLAAEMHTGGPYASLATPVVTVGTVGDLVQSWGLGLGVVTDGPHRYVYHGGNNVIFIADFIYEVEENRGYVLLTNSANGQPMVKAVEQHVFGRDLHR
jgi:CubicO group peptidase (beta-lactamase class C family)